MTMFNKISFLCFFALRENRFLSSLMHLPQLLFSRTNCRIIVSVYTHCCWWIKHDDTDFLSSHHQNERTFSPAIPHWSFRCDWRCQNMVSLVCFSEMHCCEHFILSYVFFIDISISNSILFTDNITSVIHIVSYGWKQYHSLFQRTEWQNKVSSLLAVYQTWKHSGSLKQLLFKKMRRPYFNINILFNYSTVSKKRKKSNKSLLMYLSKLFCECLMIKRLHRQNYFLHFIFLVCIQQPSITN